MILAHQGPRLRSGRAPVFALLFDMNALWEHYIAVLLRRACFENSAGKPESARAVLLRVMDIEPAGLAARIELADSLRDR